jgi:hypothetical protein
MLRDMDWAHQSGLAAKEKVLLHNCNVEWWQLTQQSHLPLSPQFLLVA